MRAAVSNQLNRDEMHTGNRDRDQYLFGGSPTLNFNFKQGSQVERMLFYAPAGGSISNFAINGNATKVAPATLNGKQFYHSLATIDIGKNATYEYDANRQNSGVLDSIHCKVVETIGQADRASLLFVSIS